VVLGEAKELPMTMAKKGDDRGSVRRQRSGGGAMVKHIAAQILRGKTSFFIENFREPLVKHLERDLFDLVRLFSFGIGLIS